MSHKTELDETAHDILSVINQGPAFWSHIREQISGYPKAKLDRVKNQLQMADLIRQEGSRGVLTITRDGAYFLKDTSTSIAGALEELCLMTDQKIGSLIYEDVSSADASGVRWTRIRRRLPGTIEQREAVRSAFEDIGIIKPFWRNKRMRFYLNTSEGEDLFSSWVEDLEFKIEKAAARSDEESNV